MANTKPILFSGPMVRAILDGRRTQTRRIAKPQPEQQGGAYYLTHKRGRSLIGGTNGFHAGAATYCPYGKPGDRLIVKEAAWLWCEKKPNGTTPTGRPKWHYVPQDGTPVFYVVDHPEKPRVSGLPRTSENDFVWRHKVARFMPRWASRITLEITGVRVERLQDITLTGAAKEGVGLSVENYKFLWEQINGAESWAANPFVWVIEFKRVQP